MPVIYRKTTVFLTAPLQVKFSCLYIFVCIFLMYVYVVLMYQYILFEELREDQTCLPEPPL